MMKFNNVAPKAPTANIAVNKSRLKVYNKKGDMPTYYLQKGQEFQIELFNPTTDTILAKITLNGNEISQGGLVLNPGQRVFLDRYLDVAKKFMFDTYEVSNTEEVREAIANNGDFKVQFYRESKPRPRNPILTLGSLTRGRDVWGGPNRDQGIIRYDSPISGGYVNNSSTAPNTPLCDTFTTSTAAIGDTYSTTGLLGSSFSTDISTSAFYNASATISNLSGEVTFDSLSTPEPTKSLKAKRSKSIETGRVEEGSHSDQKFKTVNKNFEWFAFHTVEAKLLPVSQKINTAEDIKVKVYCTNCGAKLHKDHKFCGHCGTKA